MTQPQEEGASQRSEILSRISKMGQPMLPMTPHTTSAEEEVGLFSITSSLP